MEIIEEHLSYIAYLGHRPGSIRQRGWHLGRFADWHGRDLIDVERAALAMYVARPGYSPESRASMVTHLRGFYRWAHDQGLVEADPAARLVRPRRPRHLPRPIPEAELRRALRQAEGPIREWLHLAAFAGLRCCEIAPLRGEDLLGDMLRIREQKGGDEGAVPVGPVLAEILAELAPRGWWFPRWDGRPGPITANQLQIHANRFLHSIGIEHTMHTLRHRFVTAVYEASGRDLRVTQELARHRSIASTVGYTWINPGRAAETVAQLQLPA